MGHLLGRGGDKGTQGSSQFGATVRSYTLPSCGARKCDLTVLHVLWMKYVPLLNKTEPQKISCKNPNFHSFLKRKATFCTIWPIFPHSNNQRELISYCPLPPEHELRLNYKPNGIWGRELVMGREGRKKPIKRAMW